MCLKRSYTFYMILTVEGKTIFKSFPLMMMLMMMMMMMVILKFVEQKLFKSKIQTTTFQGLQDFQ